MGTDDPTDVLAQEQWQAEQEEKRLERKRQAAEDLKWIMSDKRGRRFIWHLLEISAFLVNAFTGQREFTDFNCGKALMGQTIFADINIHCPARYETMVQEAQEK